MSQSEVQVPRDDAVASCRLRAVARGAVQGVGMRPFVYRLAGELCLSGWVLNDGGGVTIEVEGEPGRLEAFLLRLAAEAPPPASIQSLEHVWLAAAGHQRFEIRESAGGEKTVVILPDIAPCAACRAELRDPANRRHRYPFINCTHCGPRFSIIEALPYDRPNTTMRRFAMCAACRAEYEDPADRRFHAQPIACPDCGPRLELWDDRGQALAGRDEALTGAATALRTGRIVALKGVGGFQLLADARDEEAVARLRRRKRREEKPLAILTGGLEEARRLCEVSPLEARLLAAPEAPIVLLRRREGGVAKGVAPDNPNLGIMLPASPLHHLLMDELGFPIVATSGNLSDEPMATDEREALARLAGIADVFLVHDRPIARPMDDSVARVMAGREAILRRARGYAPLPVTLARPLPPVLAVGAHLKNTVALARGRDVFISQHIGDLETAEAHAAFRRACEDLPRLYEVRPTIVACDLHPDYLSTRHARGMGLPAVAVQHHEAHALACMAENEVEPPALAVAWDGTGWGPDGTVWGGEFLRVEADRCERVARLRPFPLPGGEAAVREGRRAAVGLLWAWGGEAVVEEHGRGLDFTTGELGNLRVMIERGVNTPWTSSAGRLFDAVAALTGLRTRNAYEGQAAMALEWAAERAPADAGAYPMTLGADPDAPDRWRLDWAEMLAAILADRERGISLETIAARFHNALVEGIVWAAQKRSLERVLMTGGCFQNRWLLEGAVRRLRETGFQPFWHQRVPPGDGSIALGQAAGAGRSAECGVQSAECQMKENL